MHDASCHCGAVKFRIEWTIEELTTCDCSLCAKRNAVMVKVPDTALQVVEGEALITRYQWNTRRALHHFCSRCGIYLFHRKRAAPDHFGVNIFCLDDFDPASVAVRATEGANMTLVEPRANPRWPGPSD
jgi:hypothetical protein